MTRFFTLDFMKGFIIIGMSALILLTNCNKKQDLKNNKTIELKKTKDSVFNQTPLVLWYTQPAIQRDTVPYGKSASTHIHGDPENKGWEEALPIGNGRLAGMVFGGIKRERIQLNEESLWSGKSISGINPDASQDLAEIRKLIFEGKNTEAQLMAEQRLTGQPQNMAFYQSLGDLYIEHTDIHDEENITDYYRDLHIDSAIATTHFRVGHKLFTREIFASYPDNVIVVHLTCDVPASINARVSLTREAEAETFRSPYDSTLLIQRGELKFNGLKFETQIKAVYTGGKIDNETRKLVVDKVDELTLIISAATNYRTKEHAIYAKKALLAAAAKPYDQLKKDHIEAYKKAFGKVEFNLTSADKAYDVPTDIRIERIKKGQNDKYLTELMFHYGRYLLISSSRPGCLPANLQGKWNEHLYPIYGSGYKTEWTLPLIYSSADVTNLSDLKQPLVNLIDTASIFGTRVAAGMYKANGWTAHDYLSIFGNNYPTTHQLEAIPPLGGAWLANSIYDSYRFHGDKELLKSKIYPVMKGASQFFLSFLVEVPKGLPGAGSLVVNPSLSEENEFEKSDGAKSKLSYGSALDQYLVYDLLKNTIHAIDELSVKNIKYDPQFRSALVSAIEKLALPTVNNKSGEIQEWVVDYETSKTDKNYVSQLYALYPGSIISRNSDPALAKAAKACLVNETPRLKKSSHGNALAAVWWARLGQPDEALKYLNKQITESTSPNLLSNNPPFAIDGNMIFTSAVAEMLLQSHDGAIEFLPAEPSDLGEGYAKGLVARGGFICDITWGDGKVKSELTSKNGNICRARVPELTELTSNNGEKVPYTYIEGIMEFKTEVGKIYSLSYAGGLKSRSSKDSSDELGLGINLSLDLDIKF